MDIIIAFVGAFALLAALMVFDVLFEFFAPTLTTPFPRSRQATEGT